MSRVPTGGNWLKASELKPGDTAKIITEADWEEFSYKGQTSNQYVCNVEYEGETRKLKLTMASCQQLAPVYGKDSKEWIGKIVKLDSIQVMVGGSIKKSILVIPSEITQKVDENEEEVPWDEDTN